MIRHFISQKKNSYKFWSIEVKGKNLTISSGPFNMGESKTTEKEFDDQAKCEKEATKLIANKLDDGYEEVPLAIPGVKIIELKRLSDAKKFHHETLIINIGNSDALLEEICTLTRLKKLELTNVNHIPDSIAKLTLLERLEIDSSNELTSLPQVIGELRALTILKIEHTGIETLPDSISNLDNLVGLHIERNYRLKRIPEAIGKLKRLKRLNISDNRNGFGKLENLEIAVDLPNSLGELESLEELDLHENNLTTLPETIGNLRILTKLSVRDNKLPNLPAALGKLSKLTELSLSNNPFKQIPACVFELKYLLELDIFETKITEIPQDFAKLANLEAFEFDSKKIKNIPKKIMEGGVGAIRDHLKGTNSAAKKVSVADEPIMQQSLDAHKESLEKFYRAVKDKLVGSETNSAFLTLKDYLCGKVNEIPRAQTPNHYFFEKLPQVLFPFRQWNDVDHRIMGYITQESWSFRNDKSGYFNEFYSWIKSEVQNHPEDENLFEDVILELKKYGIDEHAMLPHRETKLNECLLTTEKKLTSIGRYFLKHTDTLLEPMVKDDISSSTLQVYAMHRFEDLTPYLEEITKTKEYEGTDGNMHIPFTRIEVLYRYRPERFEQTLKETMEKIDCQSCKAEAARMLLQYSGASYHALAFTITKETLIYISKRKNENTSKRYEFAWSPAKKLYEDATPDYIDWIFNTFGKEAKDIVFKYVEDTKALDLNVIKVAVKHLGQEAVDIAGEALQMAITSDDIAGHFRQAFNLLSNLDYAKYYDNAWEVAKSEFKKVRETACFALSKLSTELITPQAIALLENKQAHVREAGALILSLTKTPDAIEALEKLLETEKNDDVRNHAVNLIYAPPVKINSDEANRRIEVAKALGKLTKPLAKWLNESTLPAVKWNTGKPLSEESIRYLFYRQKTVDEITFDCEARDIYTLIDKKSGAEFVSALLALIIKNGGFKAVNRFAIGVLAALGNDSMVDTLVNIAIEEKNMNACACLGLLNSLSAARGLDKIMQAFRTKYPNVRGAASEAFDSIATHLQITPHELKDKVIPDFGFNGLIKTVTAGKDTYTAKFSSDLKIEYYNGSNKPVKTIKWNETQKKTLKEQASMLRDSIKQLKDNLEYYLVIQRRWNLDDWKNFFLHNALAHAFARNYVWCTFEKNKIIQTFYVADEKLLDIHEHEVRLNEKEKISLLHPLSVDDAILAQWIKKIDDNKIDPPFAQLTRKIFNPDEAELDKSISYQYEDKTMDGNIFKFRAQKLGWRRGSVIDSGEVSSYRKEFSNEEIEVFISLEGLPVQPFDYESKIPVKFKEFFFVSKGSVTTGSYIYDEPRNEDDQRLIKFKDVNPIVYSEAVYDLLRIMQTESAED